MSAHKVALWTFAVSGGFYMIISIALAFRGTYVFHVTDHMKRAKAGDRYSKIAVANYLVFCIAGLTLVSLKVVFRAGGQ